MSERTCFHCKVTFTIAWTDEEAREEFLRDFPGGDITQAKVVCHDCWVQMTTLIPPPGRT